MTRTKWQLLACLAALLISAASGGCGKGDSLAPSASIEGGAATGGAADGNVTPRAAAEPKVVPPPEVLITTSLGEIRVRLFQEQAPVTVDNFLSTYVRSDFYSNTLVHYVEAGYMIAAGGYADNYAPKNVRFPIMNEATNGLKNKRGTVAMLRDPAYAKSATSQFFINLADNPSLDHDPSSVATLPADLTDDPKEPAADGEEGAEADTTPAAAETAAAEITPAGPDKFGYCVFGEVIAGMDVVDKIAQVQVHDQGEFVNTPVTPVVILKIIQVAPSK